MSDPEAPVYGPRVTVEGRLEISRTVGSKRLQPVTLALDEGTRWVLAYRPEQRFQPFDGQRVRVTGRTYDNPPTVQAVDATHFAVEEIALVGE